MLEECGLPYSSIPVNISRGDQFKPEFLAVSPNNRMPAIVDHDGPGGRPISIFESGAILQYLGRKTGKFYPKDERGRVEVEQWLFWQMANLGPKAGEANHFRNYAAEKLPYAIDRFTNEMQSHLRRHEQASRGPRISRRQIIRSPTSPASAGRAAPSASAKSLERFSERQALARDHGGAPGRAARAGGQGRGRISRRHERPERACGAVQSARPAMRKPSRP